jgi:predicted enzyme related to lactoylglutathione lyase
MKKRVTGLGGIFFKCREPQKLKEWYRDHLGFGITEWGATFVWGDSDPAKKTVSRTEWSPFKEDTTHFAPSDLPYMFNYRVDDLENLLATLRSENVEVVGEMQTYPYGKFGWIVDPEKRKIELWEPIDTGFGDAPSVWSDRVTGIGGVFFKSDEPEKITEWYAKHLGVGEDTFRWNDLGTPDAKEAARTVWSPFKKDTTYFSPSQKSYMFNYRVKNLVELMNLLKGEGIDPIGDVEDYPYGKFAWIMDPEGNKIELWEPKESVPGNPQ